MSTHFLISERAARSDTAVFDPRAESWISYGELRRLVADATAHLTTHRRKSLFTLFTSGTLADVVWYIAAIEAGHTVMLSDPLMSDEHKHQLIESYVPDWVAGEIGTGGTVGDYQLKETRIGGGLLVRGPACESSIHPDHALLLSTSGTTGSRKQVCLSRRNLECNADSIVTALGIQTSDRAITTLPLHYAYGLSVLNSHLRAGASVVLNPFGIIQPQFWSLVHETNATSMAAVPFGYQMLRRLAPLQITGSSIRVLTQAGGRLPVELIGHFHSLMDLLKGRFFVMYGQTEASARIAVLQHDDVVQKRGSVGRVITGGRICIRPCEVNEASDREADGEVVYTGPNVMLGYAEGRDDLSLGDRLHGVLHTGDTGRLDADGFLYVTGRTKRMVKVAGKRVSLDDIEHLVAVQCAHAVVGRDDEIHIFCADTPSDSFVEATRQLSAATGLHRTVFRFRRIDAIPLTSSGKTDYQNLTALL
jgi:long-chain acyl-CoA synthetase